MPCESSSGTRGQSAVRSIAILLLVAAIHLAAGPLGARAESESEFAPGVVDARGQIILPEDFRKTLVHLGSWFVPGGDASGFHDVYANPEAVDGYRRTGRFPDGSVLVKELRAHVSANYTTGADVARATESIKQWFVMVKDSKERFGDDPSWGHGWGWALFKPDAPRKSVVTDYKADCLGCHLPAQKSDWVYVEGYPTLRP